MWISKKTAEAEGERGSPARLAEITIGGSSAAAGTDGESRSLNVVSMGGYFWRPAPGETALILDCADGASVVAGVSQTENEDGLAAGEVRVSSGGASVTLKNDGSILVSGDLSLSGDVTVLGRVAVVGSLTLNGLPVAVVSL